MKGEVNRYFIQTAQGAIAVGDTKPQAKKDAPAVLFIHGHCTNKGFFSHQMSSPLFDRYRLISIDLPGYGESERPKDPEQVYHFPGFAHAVAQVVEHLELENCVIVGWSLGGHVALETTSLLHSLKGLVIFGTPPIEISEKGLSCGFRVGNPQILECFGKGNLSESEAELMATVSGYDYTKQKRFIVDAILNTDEGAKTIYPQSILKGIGQNELVIVNTWPHPIAVFGGEDDSAINHDYIIHEVKFRNLWNHQVYLIPNAGHAVHMDQPEKFNHLLAQFLSDVFPDRLIDQKYKRFPLFCSKRLKNRSEHRRHGLIDRWERRDPYKEPLVLLHRIPLPPTDGPIYRVLRCPLRDLSR